LYRKGRSQLAFERNEVAEDIEFARIDRPLIEQGVAVLELAKRERLGLVTAESCTGGLIAAVLSEAPGAADWLHGGFVTYTKENKTAALGVPAGLIARAGVVSEAVARAMAEGALARSPADVAVSITGTAGPAPEEDGTPVGHMHVAAARRGRATIHVAHDFGDIGRGANRYKAVQAALRLLVEAMSVGR
jgi:nicotinamide-nucleotide amidase